MVDMYTVYRHCMEMMHEYAGILRFYFTARNREIFKGGIKP